MTTWTRKFEAMSIAAAFAEEGEWDTAKSFLPKGEAKRAESIAEIRKSPNQRARRRLRV